MTIVSDKEKRKYTGRKKTIPMIVSFSIMFMLVGMALAETTITQITGEHWYQNNDTLVQRNTTLKVLIGENRSSTYKFEVNGTSFFNDTIDTKNHGDSSEWNTAYGWGDHSGLYALLSHWHNDTYFTKTILQQWMPTWNSTAGGNPFDQDLNTTDNVTFYDVNITDDLNCVNGLDVVTSESAKPDLIIDTNGISTKPYESCCRARLSSIQSVFTDTWTRLQLATEDYDQNNDFASSRFVVPVTGIYSVTYSVQISDLTVGKYLMSAIYVNGVRAGGYEVNFAPATVDLIHSGADCLNLYVDDYVELYVYHNMFLQSRQFLAETYTNYMTVCKIT